MSVNSNNLNYTAKKAATQASRVTPKNTALWLRASRQAAYYTSR